jgi:L-aminopeptidase/D-esterase-like protein
MTSTMDTLTDVPGLRVGHAQVPGGGSGCTVVLGPFRGAVEVAGPATGTRELEVVGPLHMVPRIDAIVLTGGSAYGLETAQGVMDWLEERDRGHRTGAGPVPIVPAAVLFDLAPGRERPGKEEGRLACDRASAGPVEIGRVGAGAGATVGKLLGVERGTPGGLGSASMQAGRWRVGALSAVNAFGDVVDRDGRAGDRAPTVPAVLEGLRRGEEWTLPDPRPVRSTTLSVVATDAPASRTDLKRIARVANTALARRIDPVHTPFDGDVTFAASTAERAEELGPAALLSLGLAAREVLEEAILRAVAHAGKEAR